MDGEVTAIREAGENGSLLCGFWRQPSWAPILNAILLMNGGLWTVTSLGASISSSVK